MDALVDEYLALACPCRFPRFRAVTIRTTHGQGGGSFTSEDQRALIRAFEAKSPVGARRALGGFPISDGMWEASCARCGSVVSRSSQEFSPGGWIDWIKITRAPGLVDVGARVEQGRVLRCRPWIATGPDMTGVAIASRAYPFVDEDAWFAWMRERAPS